MHSFYDRVTDRARESLRLANQYAKLKKHPLVTNLHVLWGILAEGNNVATCILEDMKIDINKLKLDIDSRLGKGDYTTDHEAVCYDQDVRQCICDAIDLCLKGQQVIGCHHFLQSILMGSSAASRLLAKWQVTQELVDAHMGAIVKPVIT